MTALAPLAVAVPLIAAGLLAATAALAQRWMADLVALAAAVAVAVLCVLLLAKTSHHQVVYWFGGWHPRHGVALGVDFAIDRLGAGLATFSALIVVAALLFATRHLATVEHVFHALMLVFLAAMAGFCLSGDLFNMFVFFELMSVSAYALTGYKIDQRAPLEGTLNFAVTNSVGGMLVLAGVALIYGRTGALNLAQVGQALATDQADGLVVVAFALLVSGFFVKAAVVPFHFWLPDAYAVAPTPVCVVLSAVMSELGLYAVTRVWWTSFSGALGGHEEALRAILVTAGVVTALLGALICFAQTHLKRMLAYATVSYIGLFLVGAALLTPDGLAGTAIYLVGDGFAKASLFVCVGIVQHRKARVDELRLQGEGRELPYTGLLFALGGLALASLPPFGPFLGKSLIEDAALKAGYGWTIPVIIVASILTGAAVLRAAGRVFLGVGPGGEPEPSFELDVETETETEEPHDRTPPVLFVPALGLALAALAIGLIPGLPHAALAGAAALEDRVSYAAAVLRGAARALPSVQGPKSPGAMDYVYAAISTVGAAALAALALGRERLPRLLPHGLSRAAGAAVWQLRILHSGRVGDYVAWLTVGTSLLGGLFAVTML